MRRLFALAIGFVALFAAAASAETPWPSRPVKLV